MNSIRILVLNGPNLNLLGLREPEIYGKDTLETLEEQLKQDAIRNNIEIEFFQSNYEGAIIEKIHSHFQKRYDGIIINPGGLTHTSVSLRDALLAVKIPFIEVHISNIYAREEFRQHSFLSDKALAVITGLGLMGYRFALASLYLHLNKKNLNGEIVITIN
ncbi:MAG: type II 3-dehydroquinate dehydratase [Leptonema sp. (in: bacteria)]